MIARVQVKLWLGAALIVALGVAFDLWLGQGAFARSGALLVIYGVVMVGRAVYAAEQRNARYEARFEKIEAAYLDAAQSGSRVDPEAFTRLAEAYAGFRNSRLTREGRLMVNEGGILCLGTLIWGFGDLVAVLWAAPSAVPA